MTEMLLDQMPDPPSAAAPKPRSRTALTALISTLVSALIVGGGVYTWQSRKLDAAGKEATAAKQAADEAKTRVAALESEKEKAPKPMPFFYTTGSFPTTELRTVDPQSGTDALLYRKDGFTYRIYAVPRLKYDGRIFLLRLTEGDNPTAYPWEFNVETKEEPKLVSWAKQLPFVGSAQTVSPDGTKIAAAYDNKELDPAGSTQKEIVVWNLLTGEKESIGQVAPDEYLASEVGGFAGASGFNLSWPDLKCVLAQVFRDPTDQEKESYKRLNIFEGNKVHKEYRTFCLK